MSVNRNNTDSYEEQLRQLFNSCDEEQCGFLDRSQLYELSEKLQLDEEQTSYIVDNLICDQFSKINFDEFKEVFVSLLTQTQLFNNSNNNYSNNYSNSYSTDNIKELIEKDQFNISHKNSTNSINSSELTDSSEKGITVHQNINNDFNNRSRLIKLNRCKKNKKKYDKKSLDEKNVSDRKDFKQEQQTNRKNGLTDHNLNKNNHNKKVRNSSSGTEEGYSSLDDCGSSSSSCPNVESPDLVGLSNDEDKINNSKSKNHLNHLHHYHHFLDQNVLEEDDQSSTFSTTNLNNKNCELLHEDIEQSTEQYLSSIWEQLNVGKEGYLTLKELFIVCEHIQMGTMDEELIEQLFNKLDSDNDGKVSFDELLRQLTTSSESNEFNNNTNTSVEQNKKNSFSCSNSLKNYSVEDSITKVDLDDSKNKSKVLNCYLNENLKEEKNSELNINNSNEISLSSNKNSLKPLPISQSNLNNNYSAFNSFYESANSANLKKEDESINESKEPLNKYLTVNSYNDSTKNYHKLNSSSTINLSDSCANVPSLLNLTQDSFCLPECSTELDDQQSIISKTVCQKRSNSSSKDTSLENLSSIDHKFKNLNQHHHSNHFNQCRNSLNKNLNNNNENLLNNTSSKKKFSSSTKDTSLNDSNYKTGVNCDKNYCLSSKTEFNNNENELSINKCVKNNCDKDCDKYLEQGDNYLNSKHTIEEFSANNISSNCRYSSSNVSTPELEHPNILKHHSHLHSSHHHYHIHSSSINNNVDHQNNQTAEEEDFFNLTGFGNLLSLDPFNYGYIKVSNLLNLWEQLGINNGKLILEEMGLSCKVNRIQNSEFFTMLEDTLRCSLPYSTNRDLFNAVFNTIKHEYKYLRQNYDQVKEERDKLRTSIMEANNRADLLAQEVDENHAKLEQSTQNKLLLMEKKYQEQLKYLQEELQNEREVVNIQIARLRSDCDQQVKNMQQINNKCKEYCTQLEQDNKRLEKELQECSNQLQESDKCNNEYQKELEDAIVIKKKLSELETMQSFLREREYDSFMVKMDLTRKENKELKDKNDELQMELEQLRSQLAKQENKRRNRRRRNSSEEEENDSINYDSQQLNKLFFVSQPLNRRSSKDWQPHCVPQSFYAGN